MVCHTAWTRGCFKYFDQQQKNKQRENIIYKGKKNITNNFLLQKKSGSCNKIIRKY